MESLGTSPGALPSAGGARGWSGFPVDMSFPLEKEMATHSSTLAWRITRMEEHGSLQSMGSQKSRT